MTEHKDPKLRDLQAAGFSRIELLREYRELLDTTGEDGVKRQILDAIAKIHGLMTPDETLSRPLPIIQINVVGDNTRVAAMLCPSFAGQSTDNFNTSKTPEGEV